MKQGVAAAHVASQHLTRGATRTYDVIHTIPTNGTDSSSTHSKSNADAAEAADEVALSETLEHVNAAVPMEPSRAALPSMPCMKGRLRRSIAKRSILRVSRAECKDHDIKGSSSNNNENSNNNAVARTEDLDLPASGPVRRRGSPSPDSNSNGPPDVASIASMESASHSISNYSSKMTDNDNNMIISDESKDTICRNEIGEPKAKKAKISSDKPSTTIEPNSITIIVKPSPKAERSPESTKWEVNFPNNDKKPMPVARKTSRTNAKRKVPRHDLAHAVVPPRDTVLASQLEKIEPPVPTGDLHHSVDQTSKKGVATKVGARHVAPTQAATAIEAPATTKTRPRKLKKAPIDDIFDNYAVNGSKIVWQPEWSLPRASDQQGPYIQRPHPHDVLLGRGNGIARHPGNVLFRNLCWKARDTYQSSTRAEKGLVAQHVLDQVHKKLNPPGRVIECVGETGVWMEASNAKALEKISQALREKKWFPPRLIDTGATNTWSQSAASNATAAAIPPAIRKPLKSKKHPASNESPIKAKALDVEAKAAAIKASKPTKAKSKPSTHATRGTASRTMSRRPDSADEAGDTKTATVVPTNGRSIEDIQVGSRLSIYWPLDDAYYKAAVLDRIKDHVFVRYDDEVQEWLDLNHHVFQALDPSDQSIADEAALTATTTS